MLSKLGEKNPKHEKKVFSSKNENILNIITPSGIDVSNAYANLGENTGKIYCVSKYPVNVDYGWLSNLCNLEGTSTTIEYRYTFPDRMQKALDNRIKELKGEEEMAKEESERQKIKKAIQDLEEMVNRISVRNEPVGYVNIMLHVQDITPEALNNRVKRVGSVVGIEGCGIRLLKFRQDLALKAISPYGIPNTDKVSNLGERNMPISTFAGGFPMANAGLNDVGGYYIGKTRNNRIVRLNQWLRSKDRVNSNWFISGLPGVGKSTAIKSILIKEFALGTKIIMLDPEKEYVDMTKHQYIQGNVIDCAGGTMGRINPLQVRSCPKVKKEDLEDGEELSDFFTYEGDGNSDLALYIQQLRLFFKIYFGKDNYTYDIKTTLEKCLIELYQKFNITWDTDIKALKNEDFPIMSDLYAYVVQKVDEVKEPYMKEVYRKLSMLLFSAGEGADQYIWNGYTTMDVRTDFVDLDVSNLLELDDNVKQAQFYNLIMWAWNHMSVDREQRVIFGIDEGYLFVDPEFPELMKYIRNIAKRCRKYECGLMVITHACSDILDPSVKRYGQAIIDSACYKLIMGTDGKNLEETKELFHLSEREEAILAGKNRGQGIFMCGGIRLDLKVDVMTEMLEMFGHAGGR